MNARGMMKKKSKGSPPAAARTQVEPASDAVAVNRVFIVEDHPVFREGLVQVLNRELDMLVCGEAETAEEGFPAIKKLLPDVALVDINLPGKSGLDLIKDVRAFNKQIKILVVSMYDEALYAGRVLRAGGNGYIMKDEDPDEIVHAIRDILAGHLYVSEEVMESQQKPRPQSEEKPKARPLDALSDEELRILEHLGQGQDNREIAKEAGLTLPQLSASYRKIAKKLDLKGTEAVKQFAVCWVNGELQD